MQSFNLPLSRRLDFGVDGNGHAFFKAWDERTSLHLTPDEFFALFELFQSNSEKLSQEIAELKEQRSE
jgi:hypothetical protein